MARERKPSVLLSCRERKAFLYEFFKFIEKIYCSCKVNNSWEEVLRSEYGDTRRVRRNFLVKNICERSIHPKPDLYVILMFIIILVRNIMKKLFAFILSLSFIFSYMPLLAVAANTTAATTKTTTPKPSVIAVKMTVKDWEFSQKVIKAHVGDTVRITLTDTSGRHSFALPDFSVNVPIKKGEKKTFSFKVTKKGTFVFYCGIPCGDGHENMKGNIIVS